MKEFKNYDEQIEILKSRGLKFKNEEIAQEILKKENYYFLINAYKSNFLDENIKEKKEIYIEDTHFSEIYSLYKFDQKLRNIILNIILPLENNIKAIASYYFAEEFGINENIYLQVNNFDTYEDAYSKEQKETDYIVKKKLKDRFLEIENLLSFIKNKINKNKERNKQIKHYLEKHLYIPPWVLFPVLDLGVFAQLVEKFKSNTKLKIANEYNIMGTDIFDRFLTIISFFRNISAHNTRTFNYEVRRASLHRNQYYHFLNYNNGKNKLFSLIIIFKKILGKHEFLNFFNEFKEEIQILEKNINPISFKKIKDEMGLPEDWEELETL